MYEYHCIIKRVVDGDTIDVDIDLGFDVWLKNERIRLKDIDAPEIRTRDLEEKVEGYKSMEFVENLLPVGSTQTLISKEFNKGKYGRIIGTFKVYDRSKDLWSDISTVLIEQGHAKEYKEYK